MPDAGGLGHLRRAGPRPEGIKLKREGDHTMGKFLGALVLAVFVMVAVGTPVLNSFLPGFGPVAEARVQVCDDDPPSAPGDCQGNEE